MGDPDRTAFAEQLGIGKSALAFYERGERTPDANVLLGYQQAFHIDMNWLVSGKGDVFETAKDNLSNSAEIQADIIRTLARLAERIHKEAGIKLRPEDITVEATTLYNDLCKRVDDLTDQEEVEATLPQLELRLKKKVRDAAAAPGTGKRLA